MTSKDSTPTRPTRTALALALAATLLPAYVSTATPYASCLTNTSGVISFRLNQAADDVQVVTNGVPIDLGARAAGVTVTNLGISGAYQIVVKKTSATAWTQISSDANTYCKYFAPRGVTVNVNPASAYFGRVYVSNAGAGTALSRAVGDGIYLVNSDITDAIGNLNTAATAGIDFATGGTSDPWKIGLGPDDSLYINNFSTAAATTWRTDPNVSNGSAQQMLSGIGEANNPTVHTDSASTPIVLGSLAGNDLTLYTVDGAYSGGFNRIASWIMGGGPLPWNAAPSLLGWSDHSPANLGVKDLNSDLAHGPDGKFYTCIFRSNDDTASLKTFDTDANTVLWDSKTSPGVVNATVLNARAVAVSPLGNSVALMFDDNHVDVLKLTNGIPDWSTLTVLNFTGTASGRAIAFDAAGNIYTVSSGMTLLRVFSPGGATVATTASTGTLSVSDLSTNVSVIASTAVAAEAGPVNGAFTLTRTGDTSAPLSVNFAITGSATFGVDYILSATNSVSIPAGQSSTTVLVQPIDDTIPELAETVTMTLSANAAYNLVNPVAATVTIVDNETPDISITGLFTNMYERVSNDFIQFQLTRRGLTNDAVSVNISYGGSAVNGVDFTDPSGGVVTIPAGAVTTTFKINPLDNANLDGTRSVVANIAPAGAGEYLSNAVNFSASGVITDDELGPIAPADVLFTENFDTSYAANTLPPNWNFGFIANNNVSDYNYTFGYDYSADGISAPPNTGTSFGLKVTVNKNDTSASAAGINFYPAGQSFSGNFAMRFNMLLVINSSSNQTEYAAFGINHSGTKTNWWRDNTSAGGIGNARALNTDGLFYGINCSGGDVTDYVLRTQGTGAATNPAIILSRAYTTMQQTFKNPPYSVTGEPGIARTVAGVLTTPTWVDVEVTQIGSMITLRMNNTIVLQTTNLGVFTSGNVMLGYVDPYDSIGGVGGTVYYDNLSVVRIYPLSIVSQPVSTVVIAAGGSTNLTVVTTGSATGVTNYQWQLNGVAIVGATNATLAFNNAQPVNDGVYTVVVTDGVTTLTSTPTTFVVLTPGVVIGTGTGLRGGYWTSHVNGAPYTNNPTLTRLDPTVNFDWVTGSPDASISADNFTARWVGQVQALGTETYTFTTISDDGARLWVNGQLVIDSWIAQSVTPRSGQIVLTGTTKYDLVMEYFEATGNAVAKLYWSNATTVGYSPVPQSQLYPAASVLPAITLTSPGNGANYLAPATIPLAASVTTNNNVIQYVAFYNGASLIANVTNAPYQYSWTGVAGGAYNLWASVVYNASWGVGSTTNAVTVTALTAPTISGISGTSLNYSGGAGSQFVLLKTADVSQPRSAWARVHTNTTPSGSFTIPVGSEAKAFYTIKSE